MISRCVSCSKVKKDYDVWSNKIIICATFDSVFQDVDVIRGMSDGDVICHTCVQKILDEIEKSRR